MSDACRRKQLQMDDLRHDLRRLFRSVTFDIGLLIVAFWVGCALFGPSLVPYDPYADDMLNSLAPPSADHWFGTDQLGRDVFSRVIAGARDILTVAPLATVLSTMLGTALGLAMGYFGGAIDEVLSRLVDAVLALPTVIVALLALTALGTSIFTVMFVIGFTLRADHRAHCARQRTRRARARLCGGRRTPTREPPLHHVRRNPAQCAGAHRGGEHGAARLRNLHRRDAQLHRLRYPAAVTRLGPVDSSNYGLIGGGFWWTVLFDSLAIASLVIGVNLMADGIQSALDD